jgi:hypothetical protein
VDRGREALEVVVQQEDGDEALALVAEDRQYHGAATTRKARIAKRAEELARAVRHSARATSQEGRADHEAGKQQAERTLRERGDAAAAAPATTAVRPAMPTSRSA